MQRFINPCPIARIVLPSYFFIMVFKNSTARAHPCSCVSTSSGNTSNFFASVYDIPVREPQSLSRNSGHKSIGKLNFLFIMAAESKARFKSLETKASNFRSSSLSLNAFICSSPFLGVRVCSLEVFRNNSLLFRRGVLNKLSTFVYESEGAKIRN